MMIPISSAIRQILALVLVPLLVLAANPATVARAEAPVAPPPVPAATPETYLQDFAQLARIDWPKNRALRIVAHGHSVPAGYFKTPEVHAMEAYPHLLHAALSEKYPRAVINVIVTAIGGENSEGGANRFDTDVLALHPDVLTLDYALNDRQIGLERAKAAWESMIHRALAQNIKIILLTPTPDKASKLEDPADPLNQHAAQIRVLARQYNVGLCDSLAAFRAAIKDGRRLTSLMAQENHPNAAGHALVARRLAKWFP